ncbi:SurA N-terminal domain-containing protein [Larsenimonas suaedae]|uniref:Periplasmic chaperone PpiD n=1 Tax=Larsenimonas suaedae TaxID=1851019 RepID=A0ABU1GT67_9GAMM|nr:SurA N-terminal domain-containing protein [Larsenimonas suaedae]MCM2971663.1 SurA N-terminal domain-containing protein [Larsenimonas suaedae]MDR5895215.1 SurA N-terminal domain-containing protein [Larsenimonas suaedae]
MLQHIRNRAQGWIAKVIVALIAITFTFFGVESIVSVFTQSSDDAATVNGESIKKQSVELTLQRQMRSGQVSPDNENQARSEILDQLITRALMRQYANDHGLVFTKAQVDQLIVQLPEFQDQNNHFSKERFVRTLNSAGYTPNTFRTQLEEDMVITQLRQGLAASSFVLPGEVERLAALQNQTRSFRYALIGPDALSKSVQVSDEDVEKYYTQHKDQFTRPEQVKLNYILLDKQAMASDVSVTEDALKTAYDKRKADAPKRVSDIIISINDQQDDAAAREQAQSIELKLSEGASFADLAKRYSDDPGSASKGGDLGVVTEGIFGQTFDQQLGTLSQGQVSKPFKLDNAYHIIKVTGIQIDSFDALRPELRELLQNEQVASVFDDKAQKLKDDSYSAPNLSDVAQDLKLKLHESGWVGKDNDDPILGNADVIKAAFSNDVLDRNDVSQGYNSDVIELDGDHRLVLRVADYRPEQVLPLEQVRERIQNTLTLKKQQTQLATQASSAVSALKAGQMPSVSLNWQEADAVGRNDDSVPSELIDAAFQMPRPDNGPRFAHHQVGQKQAIVELRKVGSKESNQDDLDFVRSLASRVNQQIVVSALVERLHEQGKIDK